MHLRFHRARPQVGAQSLFGLTLLYVNLLGVSAWAQPTETEDWNAHFQSTYVRQDKRAFAAAYTGSNSLRPEHEYSYSFTATAMLGWRAWTRGEVYFNPEAAQGIPLSSLTGFGGFTNGEIARSSGDTIKAYRARLFLRQTWNQGGSPVALESDANQLAGTVDSRRWVLTAGNLAVSDVFDDNAYSHDPRTQFLNWSIMSHGAYDYAADARGYSWGVALEWFHDDWTVRAGRFIQPDEPNQQRLDARIFKHFGDQIELEHAHVWEGQPGRVRLLAFRNRAVMARYDDALQQANGVVAPDLNAARDGAHIKYGVGLNLEQALSPDVGLFLRGSWADGQTETYAFTEIDRSVSGGLLIKGNRWGREADSLGLAWARNALSGSHRRYLEAGGMGFFIGDGALRYRAENVFEAFYSLALNRAAWITLDWQRVVNPAYNADRGPVNVTSLRLHTEF